MEIATYVKAYDIIILSLILHSLHLMQPLDVGVFQPLKARYQ
jgi:hypothetical protein